MDQLQVPHHSRQHMTDSEVLLLAYEKWSERMPERLVGDFAFIIWDEKRLLFGARDFSGTRTLYYHHNEQRSASVRPSIHYFHYLSYIKRSTKHGWLSFWQSVAFLNRRTYPLRFTKTSFNCRHLIKSSLRMITYRLADTIASRMSFLCNWLHQKSMRRLSGKYSTKP